VVGGTGGGAVDGDRAAGDVGGADGVVDRGNVRGGVIGLGERDDVVGGGGLAADRELMSGGVDLEGLLVGDVDAPVLAGTDQGTVDGDEDGLATMVDGGDA
jgi:hypothetical protein